MNDIENSPKLHILHGSSETRIAEARQRGCLSHVLVELPNGKSYAVFFYDAGRLQQDLDENVRRGKPFIAESGMIVVSDITSETMANAAKALFAEGFFDYLVPITQERLAKANPYHWPP